jgi:Caspase domain
MSLAICRTRVIELSVALTVGFLSMSPAPANDKPERQFALLIAAPWEGEAAMQNDLIAMQQALQRRGFPPEQILSLSGPVNRSLLRAALADVAQRVQKWSDGTVFLYYSGHGNITGTEVKTARPGLALPSGDTVLWVEVIETLRLPEKVQLVLLPDC